MRNLRAKPAQHNIHFASLPLLHAAERARFRALPFPAKRLVRRHGLTPATALVVAELAGFSMEVR